MFFFICSISIGVRGGRSEVKPNTGNNVVSDGEYSRELQTRTQEVSKRTKSDESNGPSLNLNLLCWLIHALFRSFGCTQDHLASEPEALGNLAHKGDLPFLFKVISINKALSIQVT